MIKILCVGKIKERYLVELIADYVKRINKYHKIVISELKDDVNYSKELKSILHCINTADYNIALDMNGNKIDSLEFANTIENNLMVNSNITFIIGGSNGLNDEIRNKCAKIISFSDLTFPHGLFRGILLEQIYRAFKIINNETYHK